MTSLEFQNRTLVVGDDILARTLAFATKAAASSAPVLLCGESGTGKELIARYVHEKSARSRGPFISVNCAAIPETLMEAELFGYERGAFTGAVAQRIGKFERASGGTLLLDEVSEMPIHLQAKLLRVLQEGEIDRLGGGAPIPVQSRIIATTNRDPLRLISEGKFRADLFYRLNVVRIDCAPLRGRSHAIEQLANKFLTSLAREQGRTTVCLTSKALAKLRAYEWPGNVRELRNAVERALLLAEGSFVDVEHFDLRAPEPLEPLIKVGGSDLSGVEQGHIIKVLGQSGGNRAEAARRLGISVRTLRNKLNEYGREE